jgi:hypothetical protein
MGKGEGGKKVAVGTPLGTGGFKLGKKSKNHVGLECTPEVAFIISAVLIVATLSLHIISRFFR